MDIFSRVRLRPSQMRTVADWRFADAEALRRTGKNAHANGAMYLAGFVIECLLKAQLLEKHPWLQSASSPEGRTPREQRLWSLLYRSHNLDEILDYLPSVRKRVAQEEQRGVRELTRALNTVCAEWTVFARYSPHSADIDDARDFLDQVKELRRCLR